MSKKVYCHSYCGFHFRTSNHSLGVGWNKFSIFVLDSSLATPEVVNTYRLFVFRQRRSETEKTFDKDSVHHVCAHHQVVDLLSYRNHNKLINCNRLFSNFGIGLDLA